ncbi:hypothetical protein P171DRAFT_237988 [Karstenula rhodostoma CBS 690.94]|uniref:Uncharacterized protein n=1 Tax=Karstenula rhodostoma CBS 690.94 TaxID=1392251 RepID=A0A9P4PPP0_9PLEO|nr:hypothetical protein P171DRAFT_237988 [Karstenula rhodostoma CBS 690.94]
MPGFVATAFGTAQVVLLKNCGVRRVLQLVWRRVACFCCAQMSDIRFRLSSRCVLEDAMLTRLHTTWPRSRHAHPDALETVVRARAWWPSVRGASDVQQERNVARVRAATNTVLTVRLQRLLVRGAPLFAAKFAMNIRSRTGILIAGALSWALEDVGWSL